MAELNREQIIKALECCASPTNVCKDCPVPQDVKDDCRCMEFISRNVLALFRKLTEEKAKQRTEIRRLLKQNASLKQSRDHWKGKANRVGKQLFEVLRAHDESQRDCNYATERERRNGNGR